jgi:hypothetical protein
MPYAVVTIDCRFDVRTENVARREGVEILR